MAALPARFKRARRWVIAGLLALTVLAVSGCRTITFYAQAIKGQYQLLARQEPTRELAADPATPEALRDRLMLAHRLRAFAATNLALPVDGHYLRYADLGRPYVVWNVEAAPEFSLEPKRWWYPVVGSLDYRGYFSHPAATNYAAALKKRGYDVHVGGVTAYSTLGWFKDPLLNTFLFDPEPDLAETLFHELAHQRVFAGGDTDFNEAFATFVGQEGARRWLRQHGDTAATERYEARLRHDREYVRIVMDARHRLGQLYGDIRDKEGRIKAARGKPGVSPEEMRRRKAEIVEDLRQAYARARNDWGEDDTYDYWFERPINNAKLNGVANYYGFLPGFNELLLLNGNDLARFYAEAERLAKMRRKERHAWLRTLAQSATNSAPASATSQPARTTGGLDLRSSGR